MFALAIVVQRLCPLLWFAMGLSRGLSSVAIVLALVVQRFVAREIHRFVAIVFLALVIYPV